MRSRRADTTLAPTSLSRSSDTARLDCLYGVLASTSLPAPRIAGLSSLGELAIGPHMPSSPVAYFFTNGIFTTVAETGLSRTTTAISVPDFAYALST